MSTPDPWGASVAADVWTPAGCRILGCTLPGVLGQTCRDWHKRGLGTLVSASGRHGSLGWSAMGRSLSRRRVFDFGGAEPPRRLSRLFAPFSGMR